ncbi:MAG: sialate O-acetylesterase [Rubripirellula sp.]
MLKPITLPIIALILCCNPADAQLEVPRIFSDHMVMQRNENIKVWGWSKPGDNITSTLASQTSRTKSSADGTWSLEFKEFPAGGPHELKIQTSEESITINDIYMGEVWLCSGQSNMAMKVGGVMDAETEISTANHPAVRMFTESSPHATEPQDRCKGAWQVCSPETVSSFSATAYFFGRKLQQELNVPVGLINSSVGGTAIEAWTSMPAQTSNKALKPMMLDLAGQEKEFDAAAAEERYQKALARWEKAKADNAKIKEKSQRKRLPRRPSLPAKPSAGKNYPSNLFNGKIHPLIGYAIRGVIWYQGERNSNGKFSDLYDKQLETLVADWRQRWSAPELPFAWVQLPNFRALQTEPSEPSGWVNVRAGMLRALSIPETGMAITVDVGDAKNIHPKNKQAVGARLARWALVDVYDRGNKLPGGKVAMGPLLKSSQPAEDRINLTFSQIGTGLKSSNGPLQGFAVAGEDRVFHWAEATATGDHVSVGSPQVPNPVAVRYSWAANPLGNLTNSIGLPASPFRTDHWTNSQ